MSAPVLEVVGLRKRYGSTVALDGVELSCDRGQIHALLGENGAGKTTLVEIVAGLVRPDGGEIRLGGRPVRWRSPEQARASGVAVVHQHFMLVPSLTVAENLALARRGWGWFSPEQLAAELEALARERGLGVPGAGRRVADLSVGEQQRVEILKALALPVQLLVLDEPTAVLTPGEVDDLFALLRRLARDGTAVLIVTHRLSEALSLADRVTVLRRGRVTGGGKASAFDAVSLTSLMVPAGAAAPSGAPERPRPEAPPARPGAEAGVPALSLSHLCARDERGIDVLTDVSLEVEAGAIVAVAGVEGNGQAELVAVLAGAFPGLGEGEVRIDGRPIRTAAEARRAGLAVVPPDRRREGLVAELSLWENLLLAADLLERAAPGGLLDRRLAIENARRALRRFDVRPAEPEVRASSLSGGNQQRLVLARELGRERLRAIVAANPSRGLDVTATRGVHARLRAAAAAGAGVLLVSTDLDEVAALAERVVVLYRGRLHGPYGSPFDPLRIGHVMATGEEAA